MSISKSDLHSSLKKYFGFGKFKGLQEDVVESILSGNNTFVIMPTGGGKSLCYQLPALMQEGTAIVVSPLIALMKNQVDAIRGISNEEGVAHVLNSSLNKYLKTLNGFFLAYDFVFGYCDKTWTAQLSNCCSKVVLSYT